MLRQVRSYVVPAMQKTGPLTAWIVDETGFVKSGTHSVGVARQYCRRVGKNCQIAVSLSVATESSSLPIAWRLYLPESWAGDEERRRTAGVPAEVRVSSQAADRTRADSASRAARGAAGGLCWQTTW
jgi:SRSO17 transposase